MQQRYITRSYIISHRRRFKSEAKKINKDVKFYRYSKLINIFKRATFNARSY